MVNTRAVFVGEIGITPFVPLVRGKLKGEIAMDAISAIKTRRSVRKFKQEKISIEILKDLINCAHLAPSAANSQPLEYIVVSDSLKCEEIFQTTKWAGYISDGTPKQGEKPTAFIVVLINNSRVNKWGAARDVGAAVQNILVAANAQNIGTCWIASADIDKVREILKIESLYSIDSLIALGYKAQDSVAEQSDTEVKYWLDEKLTMHVPKRPVDKVMKVV